MNNFDLLPFKKSPLLVYYQKTVNLLQVINLQPRLTAFLFQIVYHT